MSVFLQSQCKAELTMLAWYNIDHQLSFHLSSE
ncbi:hypothetical protein VIRA109638_06100 [Vibrio rarus]